MPSWHLCTPPRDNTPSERFEDHTQEKIMPEWLISLIKILVIVFGFVMAVASLLTVLGDRKQSAKIQNRIGPNRAKLFGTD